MSTELTPAEQAAAKVLLYEEGSEWAEDTDRHIELARAVVAAVYPIIESEAVEATAEAIDKDIDRMLHVDTQHKWSTDYMSGVYHVSKLVDLRAQVLEPDDEEQS